MYINFNLLYQKGFSDDDFVLLQKIKQKEILPRNANIQKFEELELVEYLKIGEIRISKKGNAFLNDLEIVNYNDDIKEIVEKSIELYDNYKKPVGNKNDVKIRFAWFVGETGFSKEVILKEIEDYLLVTDMKFIAKLDNLIWRQPNVFSAHMSKKDSKLFDIIATKYKLNIDYFLETKNTEMDWLFKISQLHVPKNSVYFVDYKTDKIRLKVIKEHYRNIISKL